MKKLTYLFLIIISTQILPQTNFNSNIISRIYTGGLCSGGLFTYSHNLFLGRGNTLSILDISDYENPIIVGNYFIGMEIIQISANDSFCIVAAKEPTGINHVFVLDIKNKEDITEVTHFSLNYDLIIDKILIKNNYLIIPTNTGKVLIYDMLAFPSLQLVSSIELGNWNSHLDLRDHYLFLNHLYNNNSKILVYDIADISNPILISTFPQSGYFDRYNFIIKDSLFQICQINLPEYCYLGESKDSTLFLYNLTPGHLFTVNYNFGNVSIIDTTEIPEFSFIVISNSYLYVALNHLDIYRIDDSSSLSLIGEFNYSYNLGGIYYKDKMIYTVNLPNTLCGIDVSDPLKPYFRSIINLPESLEYFPHICGTNNILIVGSYIYDITNRDSIQYLSQINDPSTFYSDRFCNDTLLIVSYIPSQIYNIKDPGNPMYLSSFGPYYSSVSFDDSFVFGVPGNGSLVSYFEVYDLSDPTNPIFIQRPFLNYDELTYAINVQDHTAALSTGDGSNNYKMILYQFINYTTAPIRKGNWHMIPGFSASLKREDNNIFLQHGSSNLSKIDISDLQQPVETARFSGYGDTRYFEVKNDTVYLINGNGVFIIDFNYSTNTTNTKLIFSRFSLSQNYPNPFNPSTKIKYQLPELSKVKLTVYDILGREIKTLVQEEKPAGTYEVEFDGTGLPSGVYFYRIETSNFSDTKKLILLK